MSNELSTYKKNRINEITNLYNSTISRLYSTLLTNVRNVQNSKQTITSYFKIRYGCQIPISSIKNNVLKDCST